MGALYQGKEAPCWEWIQEISSGCVAGNILDSQIVLPILRRSRRGKAGDLSIKHGETVEKRGLLVILVGMMPRW
jgi:hypothetical protein